MSGGKEFEVAIKQSDLQKIEELLKDGNIDINGCFYEPAYHDRFNTKDCSALMIASEIGHYQVAELLLNEGAELDVQDENGWSALIFAAKEGRGDLIELLNSLVSPIVSDICDELNP
jgi:ankyrin repeat protein